MKKSLLGQSIAPREPLDPYYDRHTLPEEEIEDRLPGGPLASLSLLVIGMALGMVTIMLARGCDRQPMPAVVKTSAAECGSCHNRTAAMVEYFKVSGSRSPEEMAHAVLKSKRNSKLLAAVAVVESGGNPTVRNSGYKKRHNGAYQVNPKHWGTVPTSAIGQTQQAEAILIELVAEMPIKAALNYYGGDKTHHRYADTILAELREVP